MEQTSRFARACLGKSRCHFGLNRDDMVAYLGLKVDKGQSMPSREVLEIRLADRIGCVHRSNVLKLVNGSVSTLMKVMKKDVHIIGAAAILAWEHQKNQKSKRAATNVEVKTNIACHIPIAFGRILVLVETKEKLQALRQNLQGATWEDGEIEDLEFDFLGEESRMSKWKAVNNDKSRAHVASYQSTPHRTVDLARLYVPSNKWTPRTAVEKRRENKIPLNTALLSNQPNPNSILENLVYSVHDVDSSKMQLRVVLLKAAKTKEQFMKDVFSTSFVTPTNISITDGVVQGSDRSMLASRVLGVDVVNLTKQFSVALKASITRYDASRRKFNAVLVDFQSVFIALRRIQMLQALNFFISKEVALKLDTAIVQWVQRIMSAETKTKSVSKPFLKLRVAIVHQIFTIMFRDHSLYIVNRNRLQFPKALNSMRRITIQDEQRFQALTAVELRTPLFWKGLSFKSEWNKTYPISMLSGCSGFEIVPTILGKTVYLFSDYHASVDNSAYYCQDAFTTVNPYSIHVLALMELLCSQTHRKTDVYFEGLMPDLDDRSLVEGAQRSTQESLKYAAQLVVLEGFRRRFDACAQNNKSCHVQYPNVHFFNGESRHLHMKLFGVTDQFQSRKSQEPSSNSSEAKATATTTTTSATTTTNAEIEALKLVDDRSRSKGGGLSRQGDMIRHAFTGKVDSRTKKEIQIIMRTLYQLAEHSKSPKLTVNDPGSFGVVFYNLAMGVYSKSVNLIKLVTDTLASDEAFIKSVSGCVGSCHQIQHTLRDHPPLFQTVFREWFKSIMLNIPVHHSNNVNVQTIRIFEHVSVNLSDALILARIFHPQAKNRKNVIVYYGSTHIANISSFCRHWLKNSGVKQRESIVYKNTIDKSYGLCIDTSRVSWLIE